MKQIVLGMVMGMAVTSALLVFYASSVVVTKADFVETLQEHVKPFCVMGRP